MVLTIIVSMLLAILLLVIGIKLKLDSINGRIREIQQRLRN